MQFAGTVLFNVSTGAAVWAHAVTAERRYVWAPDATGSLAFLISGALGMVAVAATVGLIELRSRDWIAGAVNLIGCVAFGVSALAAFVRKTGVTADEWLANLGTFIGALCFLVAALVALPRSHHPGLTAHQSLLVHRLDRVEVRIETDRRCSAAADMCSAGCRDRPAWPESASALSHCA